MNFIDVSNGDINIRVATDGEGPLILCVHGWPELWYSWRHQMKYFAGQGFQVAAINVRGYDGSSCPEETAAYTLRNLSSDVAAVARALSDEPVILLGHDWGAPIVWETSIRHPEVVRAVAGLSVPYSPGGDTSFIDVLKQIYTENFFYMLYFQQPDLPEAEIEADLPSALRKIYYSISGDAPLNDFLKVKPRDSSLLVGLVDPQPFPGWMTAEDLAMYVDAFGRSGMNGPINRYRAAALDSEESIPGALIKQPACFIAGEKDMVRNMIPGMDFYADPGAGCEDFRGSTIIPGVGHWIQQEAPDETNQALKAFVDGL